MNTPKPHDSTEDTRLHIARVRDYLYDACQNLHRRRVVHDESKLQEPEKSGFDAVKAKLGSMKYGSPEYAAALVELKPVLEHHYQNNTHHPEHYANGVDGMSLFDVLEMLVDWKAATERMEGGGDIRKSLQHNIGRFQLTPQLADILANTIHELGW